MRLMRVDKANSIFRPPKNLAEHRFMRASSAQNGPAGECLSEGKSTLLAPVRRQQQHWRQRGSQSLAPLTHTYALTARETLLAVLCVSKVRERGGGAAPGVGPAVQLFDRLAVLSRSCPVYPFISRAIFVTQIIIIASRNRPTQARAPRQWSPKHVARTRTLTHVIDICHIGVPIVVLVSFYDEIIGRGETQISAERWGASGLSSLNPTNNILHLVFMRHATPKMPITEIDSATCVIGQVVYEAIVVDCVDVRGLDGVEMLTTSTWTGER